MKKLFLLSTFMMLFASCVLANTTITMTGTGDTLVNATSDSVLYQVKGTYANVSVQAVFTKVSGTVAGRALLYASIDGINYVQVNTDTLAFTNIANNTKVWVLNQSNYMYYKVKFTGVGTMSGIVKGYIFTADTKDSHSTITMLSDISASSDTVTNSASGYVQYQVKNGYSTVSLQVVVSKISGTAGGTVTLQGSNDGVNYVTVDTSYSDAQTLSVSNITTNTKIFVVTGSPYSYYRLSYTGTGTMACRLQGYLLANR